MARGISARLLAGALVCVAFGLTSEARANFYAYAVQQTSGYTFTGGTLGPITPLSSTSSAQVGNPSGADAHTGGFDALQSYVGPVPRPAENLFTPVGQINPDYARGDALVTAAPDAFTTNNVAEAYMVGPGNSAGSGSWAVSAAVTIATAGTVTLGFNYTNLLTVVNTGSPVPGTVIADYGYTFTIRNSAGTVVFQSSPTAVNNSVSLSTIGNISTPGSGSVSITSGTLGIGTYTATISGSEHTFINSAVPEPSTLISAAFGLALAGGAALRNRRRAAK